MHRPDYPDEEPHQFHATLTGDWGKHVLEYLERLSRGIYCVKAAKPTQLLRSYVKEATLPLMVLPSNSEALPVQIGRKSHLNHLSVRPEPWRRLVTMQLWDEEGVNNATNHYINRTFPDTDMYVSEPDMGTAEYLTIPCKPWFYVPETILPRASDLSRISMWVRQYPLATAQRIVHLLFPPAKEWCFSQPVPDDQDPDFMTAVTWDCVSNGKTGQTCLVVLIQPPWILSAGDLDSFVRCCKFPVLEPGHDPDSLIKEYTSKIRLWGKVWDFCARRDCNWWAVTTYWGWVFGAFSPGLTRGYACNIRVFDSKAPTVLEHLVLWLASAMDLDGIPLPLVSTDLPLSSLGDLGPRMVVDFSRINGKFEQMAAEPVSQVLTNAKTSMPAQLYKRLVPPPLSESSWDARSLATVTVTVDSDGVEIVGDLDEEEAEVDWMLSAPLNDEHELVKPLLTEARFKLKEESMVKWQLELSQRRQSRVIVPLPPPSVISTTRTVSSAASTVKDYGGRLNGDWLNLRTPMQTISEGYW